MLRKSISTIPDDRLFFLGSSTIYETSNLKNLFFFINFFILLYIAGLFMAFAYLGFGSNLGNGISNLLRAWKNLSQISDIIPFQLSNPYITSPVDMHSLSQFTNAVGIIETNLLPLQLLDAVLSIEKEMGRDRSKGRDRQIDIDILLYDHIIYSDELLIIPHPEMEKRLFVLVPFNEIASQVEHPLFKKTIGQLLSSLPSDNQFVKKSFWPDNEVLP